MALAQALVTAEQEQELSHDSDGSHNIPKIPLHITHQIKTRADFIKSYDHINLFTITSTAISAPTACRCNALSAASALNPLLPLTSRKRFNESRISNHWVGRERLLRRI
jgi:hypothetical protein